MPGPKALVGLSVSLVLLSGVAGSGAFEAPTRPPNVVLIVADDLGWGDIGVHGQERIETPHIDRLASEGLRFSDFYAGSTVCAPSRAVLMTGRHTGHASVRGNAGPDRQVLRQGERTLAHVFRDRGYATGLFGKWGLGDVGSAGHPNAVGFQRFFGYLNQTHAHNYYPTFLFRDAQRVPLRNVAESEAPNGSGVARLRRDYAHDIIVDEALSWLDAHHTQPFFLFLAVTLPHANNEARRATGNGQEVPELGRYARLPWSEPNKGLAAMVSRLDRDVGRLVARLEEHGIRRDTLVLFTSDNGPHQEGGNEIAFFRSNGPFRGHKRSLYEGGIRVPLLASWPGRIRPRTVSAHPAYFGDFFATFSELVGLAPPAGLDSISLVPTLLGGRRQETHQALYWEFHEQGGRRAVRFGPWKAIQQPGFDGPVELYLLETDPGEANDLARSHPKELATALRLLREARHEDPLWPAPVSRP